MNIQGWFPLGLSGKNGIIKIFTNINAGEDVEKRDPSCTVGGNINQYSDYG